MKPLFLLVIALVSMSAGAAGPISLQDVPPALRPWLPWVFFGEDSRDCPPAHDDGDRRACLWPGELSLDLDAGGGRFSYRVEAYADGVWLTLPGDAEHWPTDVRGRNGPLPVVARDGLPQVRLPAGAAAVQGRFNWHGLPRSLVVPRDAAIVRTRIAGRVADLQPGDDGALWLQPAAASAEGNSLTTRVFRLLDDDVPMRLGTQFELGVSGQAREVRLPAAVPDGFVATSIESPLPARLAADGSLRVQARPGNWRLLVGSRKGEPTADVAVPATIEWPEEVWAFRSRAENGLRTAAGGVSVDPRQIAMVDDWKGLPAYRLLRGEALRLQAGGQARPRVPNRLSLDRQVWLDFDGSGFTFQDRILGELASPWRLEASPAVALGRIAVDAVDQPVTRLTPDAGAGVELRSGRLDVNAEGRFEDAPRSLPVSGWNVDLAAVRVTLHVPPGWRLIHAGSDRTYGSWWSRWDLWAAFFVLLTAMAVGRLHGRTAGLVALAALVASWQLDEAPQLLWPALVGVQALGRVLPDGRLKWLATWGERLIMTAILVLLAALAVTLARQTIHPSLELPGVSNRPVAMPLPASLPAAAPQAMPMQEERAKVLPSVSAEPPRQAAQVDPAARVQTGPGLPAWHWHAYSLSWAGPIGAGQDVKLWLLPPWLTGLVNVLTLALLGSLVWIVGGRRRLHWPGTPAALPAMLAAVFLVALPWPQEAWAVDTPPAEGSPAAGADSPSDARLAELRRRLLLPADCLPDCVDVPEMELTADHQGIRLRLKVHALMRQMLPLPGQRGQFAADRVTVDGQPAPLRRDENGQMWLALRAGVHDVMIDAAVLADSVQIALPLLPRHLRTDLSGWTLSGLDERGRPGAALTLVRDSGGRRAAGQQPASQLPPFVRVTRLLSLDERWTLTTTLRRDTPSQVPAEVRVPLLAGESVTDPGIRVVDGQAVIVVGPGAEVVFHSNLAETAELKLVAASAPNQTESWRLEADGRWHVDHEGLEPLAGVTGDMRPGLEWRPWPGQELRVKVTRPHAIEGETMTVDRLGLSFSPGKHATDVTARLSVRSSLGRNHVLRLPAGAQLQRVSMDERPLPLRIDADQVVIAVEPGSHRLELVWREGRGIGEVFRTSAPDIGARGANVEIELRAPDDRVVLAAGGPLLGPAVLFWGALAVAMAIAWLLARLAFAPMGLFGWLLLEAGLLQWSPEAAVLVTAWFAAMALRRRHADAVCGGWMRTTQTALAVLTLAAAGALLATVHAGLLGYPDLMVEGNGSSGNRLFWYDDRLSGQVPEAWLVSMPLWAYRLFMLAWALWLARSVIDWVRWGWLGFATGGYWPARRVGERRGWFRRRQAVAPNRPEDAA